MSESSNLNSGESRRGFLGSFSAWMAALVGAVLGVGPVCVGIYSFVMDPLRDKTANRPRKSRAGGSADADGFYRVASVCLLYTSPSPRDAHESRMPSSA